MYRMGVDVGYGYCKAVAPGGKRILFPSLVAPDSGRRGWQLLGGEDSRVPYVVRLSGGDFAGSYAVGEAALQRESAVRAWDTREQATHRNSLVLLFTAAAALGAVGDVELGIGTPLEIYGAAREEVSQVIQKAACRVSLDGGAPAQVAFRRVWVFPQAGGAYLNLLLGQDGQVKNPQLLGRTVGVIDVGYRTTDLLMLVRGKGGAAVPDPDLSTTVDQGISEVYHHVWMALQARLGVPVDLLWVERAFMWHGGALTFRGQALDLEPDAQAARESLAALVEARVKQLWGSALDLAEHVILTGGGGKELFPYLRRGIPGLELDRDPVFSNALGYLAAMAYAVRRA